MLHNSALGRLIGAKGAANLEAFSRLRIFQSTDFTSTLSLISAARKRYSEHALAQEYQLDLAELEEAAGADREQEANADGQESIKMITF